MASWTLEVCDRPNWLLRVMVRPSELWIGLCLYRHTDVIVRMDDLTPAVECHGETYVRVERIVARTQWDIVVCLLPCLPIHLRVFGPDHEAGDRGT